VPSDSNRSHAGLKQRWLRILQTGAGSLVVAAAIVSAPPAKATQIDARASVAERVEQAKEWMREGGAGAGCDLADAGGVGVDSLGQPAPPTMEQLAELAQLAQLAQLLTVVDEITCENLLGLNPSD